MFRANQHAQGNPLQRQEDSIRQKISAIDLKSSENMARSLEAIEAILGMLDRGHFSHAFISDMYYETRDSVDEHHEKIADESFMALPVEARRSIGYVNVQFARIFSKFEELWEDSTSNLRFE